MQNLKIGIVQTQLFWEDRKTNFNHFENQFFNQIGTEKPDLILLPEMFNSGFSMNVQITADTMDGETVKWMKCWAKKLNCHIGGSLVIFENEKYYNRFLIVSENGVEANYDKRHLFRMANEDQFFNAGDKRVVFQLKGWSLMLQVCYDLRFPVFSRNKHIHNKKEYDAVIYVANWPAKRAFIWKNLIQARAIENQAYSIGVNRIGVDANKNKYSGDSMVVDPWGKIITQIDPNKETIQIITLEKSILETINTSFPAYLDAD